MMGFLAEIVHRIKLVFVGVWWAIVHGEFPPKYVEVIEIREELDSGEKAELILTEEGGRKVKHFEGPPAKARKYFEHYSSETGKKRHPKLAEVELRVNGVRRGHTIHERKE